MSASENAVQAQVEQSGFIDVLRSRWQWPQTQADEQPFGFRRRLPLPPGPVFIESVQLAEGLGRNLQLASDEFVLVLSGSVQFRQAGREFRLKAGDAGVLLRHKPLGWSADKPTDLIVMRCTTGGGSGADQPVVIDVGAPLAPSNPPLAELLVGDTPTCRNHTDYRSASGEFLCGTWDSTPYHRQLMKFRHFELMSLLEGEVTFVDQLGNEGTFGAGDVVLLVQGGGCSWESREHVKKIYSTYRPNQ
jgi:uncharacterized cupin superfamily protein